MVKRTHKMEQSREQFDSVMDAIAPLCLEVIHTMIKVCIETGITPVIGLMTLSELIEHNLQSNKPEVKGDDGWDQLREWIQESIEDHIKDENSIKIEIPSIN